MTALEAEQKENRFFFFRGAAGRKDFCKAKGLPRPRKTQKLFKEKSRRRIIYDKIKTVG